MKFHVVVIMYYARYEASFDPTTRFKSAFGISISLEKESRGRPRQRNGCIQVGPGEACGDVARLDALLCLGQVLCMSSHASIQQSVYILNARGSADALV